ncbi:MAG: hypothetical protein PUA76_06275 [Bacteroidales bacterium]|nr:hypothetical protein [Bacteroidales bacterium]
MPKKCAPPSPANPRLSTPGSASTAFSLDAAPSVDALGLKRIYKALPVGVG